MAEQGSVHTNFAAGKTPQRMRGRYDHPLYLNGYEVGTNVIATPGGSIIRRPGSKSIFNTSSIDDGSRIIGFQDQENNGALLIFEPNNSLFVVQDDAVVKNIVSHNIEGGALTLEEMDYVQVRDYMFFVHRSMAPKMLVKSRTETSTGDGATTAYDFPYPVPDTADIIVKVDGVTQTLTTDYAIATFDKVDGQYKGVRINFVVAPPNNDSVEIIRDWGLHTYPNLDGPWEVENVDPTRKIAVTAISTDDDVTNGDGHYGACTIRAVAKKGKAKTWMNDSWVGRDLRVYSIDSNNEEQYATISIDSVTTTKSVYGGTVSQEYPMGDEATSSPYSPRTKRWALSAWYAGQYPEVVGVHQDSLWFGRDRDRWKTVSGSLFTFSPTQTDDEGIHQVTADSGLAITGSDPVASKPTWLFGDQVLFSGTDAAQFIIQGGSTFGAIAPSTVSIIKQNTIGAARIKPVAMNDLYFVDNLRRNIYKMDYEFRRSSFVAEHVNKYDDLLFEARIRRMAVIEQPFPMIWCVMDDKSIICVTINETDGTYAASTFTGVDAFDIAVLKQSDGTENIYVIDDLGGVVKYGEFNTQEGASRTSITIGSSVTYGTTTDREYMTDYAVEYSGGVSIDLSTITTGTIVVDDTNYENWVKTSSSKSVTPTNDYENGFPFYIYVKTNRVLTTQGNVTDSNKKRQLKEVSMNLHKTMDFQVRSTGMTDYKRVKFSDAERDLTGPGPTFTGNKNINLTSSKNEVLQMEITQDKCTPLNINSIIYEYEI